MATGKKRWTSRGALHRIGLERLAEDVASASPGGSALDSASVSRPRHDRGLARTNCDECPLVVTMYEGFLRAILSPADFGPLPPSEYACGGERCLITELVKSGELMTEYQENLPFMPITQGVVFPGMIVTLALETDEARAAVEAAGSAGGRLVLVPHIDRRYSSIGVVAEIVQAGEAGGGTRCRGAPRRTPRDRRSCRADYRECALGRTSKRSFRIIETKRSTSSPVSTARCSRAPSCQGVLDSSLSSCAR